MRVSSIRQLFKDIDHLPVDDSARRIFKQLLAERARQEGITGLDREGRVAFAQSLLFMRMSKPTVRDRLMAHYGISSRQAERVINDALKLRHKSPVNVATISENSIGDDLIEEPK
jgi:hypothetical protein